MLHDVEICIYSDNWRYIHSVSESMICFYVPPSLPLHTHKNYKWMDFIGFITSSHKSRNNGICIIICAMSALVSFDKRPFILFVLITADELQGFVEGPHPRLRAPHATYWAHCGQECVPFHGLNSPTKSMSIIQRQRVSYKKAPDHHGNIDPDFLLHLGEKPRPTILHWRGVWKRNRWMNQYL